MRYPFAETLLRIGRRDKKVILMTGDLGFNLFEPLQKELGPRFINAGVAEHNMISAAAGLAYAGFQPWVYSIAPFVTIKVLEEIRNDVCIGKRDVKVIGLGGGFDYAIAGATHHMLNDIALMGSLPDMHIFTPGFPEDVAFVVSAMHILQGPAYLRLTKAEKVNLPYVSYKPCRNILKGERVTVIVLGSVIGKVAPSLNRLKQRPDIFLVTEIPFTMPKSLIESIRKTGKVLIIEEHVEVGGLGQYVNSLIRTEKLDLSGFDHLFVKGYISKKYGSRDFYLEENGFSSSHIAQKIKELL